MRIVEFVDKVSASWPTQLKTTRQIEHFMEECKDYLKYYEGEILGFAYHELKLKQTSRTHPLISEILAMCKQKEHEQNKPKQKVTDSEADQKKINTLVMSYKTTENYNRACRKFIGNMAEAYCMKHGKFPEKKDYDRMIRESEHFVNSLKTRTVDGKPMPDAIFKLGKAVYRNELDYMRDALGLYPLDPDHDNYTFQEHKNLDYYYPY